MKLWELRYTLTSKLYISKHVDYWWSTSEPGISTASHYWDAIFPGYYKVTNMTARIVDDPNPTFTGPQSYDWQPVSREG